VSHFDSFYPESDTIRNCPGGLWCISLLLKMESYLQKAKNGDSDAESRLCNRIGQLRRHFPSFNQLPGELGRVTKESVDWLRSVGRVVNLKSENPIDWISIRGGGPRWL